MTTPRPAAGPTGADDATLVARLGARDAAALEEIYTRYARICFALARRILADELLAQDVVQEVFLVLWRDPGRYDAERGSFSSWLLALTHHKAVDVVRREENLRRRRTTADVLEFEESPGTPVADEVLLGLRRDRVRAALRSLPPPQREALALAYFGGYTQREIASLTGQPLGTVKTRMLLGMRRLRDTLRGDEPGERSATTDSGAVS